MENSPYSKLIDKEKVKVDFRPFIHVEGVDAKEVRQQKIDLHKFTAIILTSRNAVDHFFRIAEEMRFKVPDSMKYFCQSEAVAYYLQKYVVYRKRKIYVGKMNFPDLEVLFKKYKGEKFLLPSSDSLKAIVPETLDKLEINWTRGIFYKTVISDLSDLKEVCCFRKFNSQSRYRGWIKMRYKSSYSRNTFNDYGTEKVYSGCQ